MRKSDEVYSDSSRRFHRILAHYLALWCWTHNVDCVILDRKHMITLFGMDRFVKGRLDQIDQDVKPWFPTFHVQYRKRGGATGAFLLSRFVIPDSVLSKVGTPTDFARWLGEQDISSELYPEIVDEQASNLHEDKLVEVMTLIAMGLRTANDLPQVA